MTTGGGCGRIAAGRRRRTQPRPPFRHSLASSSSCGGGALCPSPYPVNSAIIKNDETIFDYIQYSMGKLC